MLGLLSSILIILGLYTSAVAPSDTYTRSTIPLKTARTSCFFMVGCVLFELYSHSTQHEPNGDGGCRHRVPVCARYFHDLDMDRSCGRKSGVISPAGWDKGTRRLYPKIGEWEDVRD